MQSFPICTRSVRLTGAVIAERFVTAAGAQTAADGNALGVTRSTGAVGELVPVDCLGTAIVETGGAFLRNATIKADASGRAIAWADAGARLAVALQDSSGAGRRIEVFLIPNAA